MTRIAQSLYPDRAAWTTGKPISIGPICRGRQQATACDETGLAASVVGNESTSDIDESHLDHKLGDKTSV
jgi:hypothetical protein